MMQVQVIKKKSIAPVEEERVIKRTCAYARVSTSSDEQEMSFEAQQAHYQDVISNNPDLEFAGIYADEGVTGTSTAHREGFKQMMQDAREHKFDQIFTKSISRFGRNTLDSISSLRELKDLGIGVRFEKEGIWTLDNSGETLIVIMSSLAQAESQSISENVKMGIRYRFQEGKPFINCSRFLGYDKDDGKLVVNPDEAMIVRRIFSDFLNGHSADMIAAALSREGVPTVTGGKTWYPSAIRYIISNEKYKGDLRLQKTVVPNFLTHKCKKNTGEADQYYVENSHDPIIPREVFDMAQAEAARRAAARLTEDGGRSGGVKYGSRSALQGRCRCACGNMMKRRRGSRNRWFCPACGRSLRESEIQEAVLESFRKLGVEEGNLEELLANANECIASTAKSEKAEDVRKRAEALFRRFHIMSALDWIRNEGKESLMAGGSCYTVSQFIDATRPAPLIRWSDETVLRFIESVEVGDGVTVHYRAGVTVISPIIRRVYRPAISAM